MKLSIIIPKSVNHPRVIYEVLQNIKHNRMMHGMAFEEPWMNHEWHPMWRQNGSVIRFTETFAENSCLNNFRRKTKFHVFR